MTKSIGFLAPSWKSASAYYRLQMSMGALERAGYEVFMLDDYDVAEDGHIIGRQASREEKGLWYLIDELDMIFTQGWQNNDAPEVLKRAKATGQKQGADVDDHYWRLEEDNPAYVASDPDVSPMFNRKYYLEQLRLCDIVVCSTVELVDFLASEGCNPVLRRNCVDLGDWIRRDTTRTDWSPRVGWTGASPWRMNDLRMVGPWVGEFLEAYDLQFAHYGWWKDYIPATTVLGIPKSRIAKEVEFRDWVYGFAKELDKLEIDIGIIPISDNSFNRAKSNLKGLEFAACGIPYVASALPEYRHFAQGILVENTAKAWRDGLDALLDPIERQVVADCAYEHLERYDTIQVRSGLIVGQFKDILGSP